RRMQFPAFERFVKVLLLAGDPLNERERHPGREQHPAARSSDAPATREKGDRDDGHYEEPDPVGVLEARLCREGDEERGNRDPADEIERVRVHRLAHERRAAMRAAETY